MIFKNSCLKFLAFIFTLSLGAVSFAQEGEEEVAPPPPKSTKSSKSGKSKRTEVNFEDQLIKGEVQKPELFYLLQKKQFNFSKLIKLRENFLPEMKKSSEEVPRGVED